MSGLVEDGIGCEQPQEEELSSDLNSEVGRPIERDINSNKTAAAVDQPQPVVGCVVFECPICLERKATRPSLRSHLRVQHDIPESRSRRVQRVMESKVRRVIVDDPEEVPQLTPQRAPAKPAQKTKKAAAAAAVAAAAAASLKDQGEEGHKAAEEDAASILDKLYYNCRICFQAFDGMEGLEVHIQEEHPNELAEKVSACTEPVLDCWYCEKSFANKPNVVRHVVQFHHGFRPYTCLLCNDPAAKFFEKRDVIRHLEKEHLIVKDTANKAIIKASFEFHAKPPFNVDPIPKDMYFIG